MSNDLKVTFVGTWREQLDCVSQQPDMRPGRNESIRSHVQLQTANSGGTVRVRVGAQRYLRQRIIYNI
jgi:hypothetical protein